MGGEGGEGGAFGDMTIMPKMIRSNSKLQNDDIGKRTKNALDLVGCIALVQLVKCMEPHSIIVAAETQV